MVGGSPAVRQVAGSEATLLAVPQQALVRVPWQRGMRWAVAGWPWARQVGVSLHQRTAEGVQTGLAGLDHAGGIWQFGPLCLEAVLSITSLIVRPYDIIIAPCCHTLPG